MLRAAGLLQGSGCLVTFKHEGPMADADALSMLRFLYWLFLFPFWTLMELHRQVIQACYKAELVTAPLEASSTHTHALKIPRSSLTDCSASRGNCCLPAPFTILPIYHEYFVVGLERWLLLQVTWVTHMTAHNSSSRKSDASSDFCWYHVLMWYPDIHEGKTPIINIK